MRFVVVLNLILASCVEYGMKGHLPFSSAGDDTATSKDEPKDEAPPDDPPEDPDTPPPEAFSYGWHILDSDEWVSTTSSASHPVTEHGDTDSYWYEPSGEHGMLAEEGSSDAFGRLRNYVIERVPEPAHTIGNLHYYADSTVESFNFATFTYVLCDFMVADDDDPFEYTLRVGAVDDGIEVIVNGEILGFLKLDEGGQHWSLGEHILPGERNTLVVILVDNAERNKFIQDLAFFRGEIMVTGTPSDLSPP